MSIEAIILVGGLGTRLRPLYADRPKALVPVGGRPMLAWLVDMLRDVGVQHVHLATSYLGEAIDAWVTEQSVPDLRFTLSRESSPLGTAGAIGLCASQIETSPFLVLNGDSLLPNLSVRRLFEAHRDTEASLAAVRVPDTARFGKIMFDRDGFVQTFQEKSAFGPGCVNGGAYVLTRDVLKRIPADRPLSLEADVFPQLAGERQLRAVEFEGPLLDMGTPEGLDRLNAYLTQQS